MMSRSSEISRRAVQQRGRRSATGAVSRRRFNRARVEQVVATSAAVAALVFGAQTVGAVLAQWQVFDGPWYPAIAVLVYAALIAAVVAGFLRRGQRLAFGVFAVTYLAATAAWPLLAPEVTAFHDRPWLWQLVNLAAAAAVIAFPLWLGAVYTLVVPVLFSWATILPNGGANPFQQAVLDAWNMLILGTVVVVIIAMLRRAGDQVDRNQVSAMQRYTSAAREHALDRERVRVDGLLHDSVLATLLIAARADSDQQQAAAAELAEVALARLREHGNEGSVSVTIDGLVDGLRELADRHGFRWRSEGGGALPKTVTSAVSSAITGAAAQAIQNSLAHAEAADTERSVVLRGEGNGVLVLEISDDGPGFELESVPPARLGVRVSIIERMADIGGQALVDTAPGAGTTVTLRWPAVRITRTLQATALAVREARDRSGRAVAQGGAS